MTAKPPRLRKIPGLRHRQRADGSWRVWWEPGATARAAGQKPVELDADRPTWSERQAEALNARSGKKGTTAPLGSASRSIAALINVYRRDPEFLDKKPKTRASYTANLRIIEAKWGPHRVAEFSKAVLRDWYQANRAARGDAQALALHRMMSILFSFAELKGWRAEGSNPAFRIKARTPRPRNRVATWDELDALIAAADAAGLPSVGTAALLSALQGQRQTDVIAATRDQFHKVTMPGGDQPSVWAWRVDRSKRGTLGLMRLHPIVQHRLMPRLIHADPDACLLGDERNGTPYHEELFQRRWREVRATAAQHQPSLTGADQLQFRDLRRTFAVWAKAGGATDDDVGDVLGNTAALDPRLQETYMPPSFETASRAVLTIRRPQPEKRRKA